MAVINALICICLLGYLAQTTGLCMVRGVNEWKAGNPEFLLAIMSSGALAWAAMSFSYYSGTPLSFRAYDASIWFALGGVIFGIGTALNQGCGVSTLSKLARGDTKMVATIIGWLAGWSILVSLEFEPAINHEPHSDLLNILVMMVFSIILSTWVIRGDQSRRKLWFGMMAIGLLAGFLFLFEPKWPPSGLLNHLSASIIDSQKASWPSMTQYLLFVGLLIGMLLAAWRTQKFHLIPSQPLHWVKHILAGTLMGIGASLAMGGNDTQLLLALPTLSSAGFITVLGMITGIRSGLFVVEKFKI